MKRIITLFLCICIVFTFVSCSSNDSEEYSNPYQAYEETTKIKNEFNSNKKDFEKITVTIADTETAVDISNDLLELFESANIANDEPEEELSTILAYIKIYYNDKTVVDYGRLYSDSNANVYLVSNYNQNEKAALLVTNNNIIGKLIFPDNKLF